MKMLMKVTNVMSKLMSRFYEQAHEQAHEVMLVSYTGYYVVLWVSHERLMGVSRANFAHEQSMHPGIKLEHPRTYQDHYDYAIRILNIEIVRFKP